VSGFEPTIFGRYALLKRIAIGGMAEVFRAMTYGVAGFEKLIAIKRLLPHMSQDEQFIDMFINEAKLAAILSHGNIVQIYDFGSIKGQLYIAMEYIHGQDLSRLILRLRQEGYAPPHELVCHLLLQVLDALQYAHQPRKLGGRRTTLVHRDISPPNILLSYSGEVKLADFGIAKALRETSNTGSGVLKGKYGYMSPEQVRGERVDQRSDIYSLGVCLYELLTQREMFTGRSEMDILEKVRSGKFARPREFDSSIPRRLEQILLRALQLDPRQRYQNAAEFRQEVEQFVIDKKYHFSAAWLADFMREIFGEKIALQQVELDEEMKLAERMRPDPERLAAIEAEMEQEVETLIHRRPLLFDGEDSVEFDQGQQEDDEDEDDASTVMATREELLRAQAGGEAPPGREKPGPDDVPDLSGRFTQPTAREIKLPGPSRQEAAPQEQPRQSSLAQEWFSGLPGTEQPSGQRPEPDPVPAPDDLVSAAASRPAQGLDVPLDLPSGTIADLETGESKRRFPVGWVLLGLLLLVAALLVWLLVNRQRQEHIVDGGTSAAVAAAPGSGTGSGSPAPAAEPDTGAAASDSGVPVTAGGGPPADAGQAGKTTDAGQAGEKTDAGQVGEKTDAGQVGKKTAAGQGAADAGEEEAGADAVAVVEDAARRQTTATTKPPRAARKKPAHRRTRKVRRPARRRRAHSARRHRRSRRAGIPRNLNGPPYLYVDRVRVKSTAELSKRLNRGVHTLELRDVRGRVVRRWQVRVDNN